MPTSSSDLHLVNLLLWSKHFATKMWRQEIWDDDQLKRILLHCWVG